MFTSYFCTDIIWKLRFSFPNKGYYKTCKSLQKKFITLHKRQKREFKSCHCLPPFIQEEGHVPPYPPTPQQPFSFSSHYRALIYFSKLFRIMNNLRILIPMVYIAQFSRLERGEGGGILWEKKGVHKIGIEIILSDNSS